MLNIENLYTEKCKFKSFKDENLDLFSNSPNINYAANVLLDPRTGLILDHQTKIPTDISKTIVINSNKGWNKSWIRSTPNYASNTVKKQELEERLALLDSYIQDILIKEIIILDERYTYVNLCNGSSYAYGHLADLVLKVMYLPETLTNVCFLISDENGIKDIKDILKIVSNLSNVSFKLIKPTEKKLFLIKNVVELKQTNGMCNFSNTQEYDLFVTRVSSFFINNNKTPKNVFLTRRPPLKRHILNFTEVHKQLSEHNVHIITGEESFIERAEILHKADRVCGYHGALFFDTCFCKKHTQILEYVPITRPAKCFLKTGKQAENYYIKFSDNIDDNFNINIDIQEILAFYNNLDFNNC